MGNNICFRCGNELKKGVYVCPKCMIKNSGISSDSDQQKEISNIVPSKLIACSECNKEISRSAPVCPHCGFVRFKQQNTYNIFNETEKKKKDNKLALILGIALVVIVGITYISSSSHSEPQPRTKEEIRYDQIKTGFSAWDGSHIELTKLIKRTMNNPNSYEHVETTYSDNGDHLIVSTTFRGTNAFGGVVTNRIAAKVSLNGTIIQVLSQGQ